MLGIDRRAARYVWTGVLVLLLIALVYIVRKTLFIFVVAVLLAYLLSPLVNLFDRILPASRTRTPALGIAYIIFVGILVLIGSQIGAQVVEQANALSKRAPEMLAKWEQPSPSAGTGVNTLKQSIIEKVRVGITRRSGDLISELGKAGIRALSIAGDLIYVIIVPILAFFFLKDGREMREHFLSLIDDGPRRELVDDLLV